jgi:hypothetical protein
MSAHAELVILRHELSELRRKLAEAKLILAEVSAQRDMQRVEMEQLRADNLQLAKRLKLVKAP